MKDNLEFSSKSKEEKIKYFLNLHIEHKRETDILNKIMDSIRVNSGNVYFVIGPSGVGKTTLIKEIKKQIFLENTKEIHSNNQLLPAFSSSVPLMLSTKIGWETLFLRIFDPLCGPIYNGEPLNPLLKEVIRAREVKAILLDEAQYLKMYSKEEITSLKMLFYLISQQTGCNFIFFGDKDLFGLTDDFDEEIIFFNPYIGYPQHFRQLLISFQRSLPFKQQIDLLKYSNLIFERTQGYISKLKPWLNQSVIVAIEEEKESEFEDIFLRYTPSK